MCRSRRWFALAGSGLPLAWLGCVAVAVALGGCAASSAGDTPPQAIAGAGLYEADDPREPFSRSYGSHRSTGPIASLAAMSDAEAEALIARAIAEHEMRRP